MVKLLFVFLAVSALVASGIKLFEVMSWSQRWKTTKVVGFSVSCGIITSIILTFIVVIF